VASIPQQHLFSWHEVDADSDIHRLSFVLDALPDEALVAELEARRGHGRDDYPIRATWNSILAGAVFGHPSIESLRRELSRNGELRDACGFDPMLGSRAVPPSWAYTRFVTSLIDQTAMVDKMFDQLVDTITSLLPDFGRNLGIDGKAIASHGKPSKRPAGDRRRDTDADWGAKTYHGKRDDGTLWSKVTRWFGYKLHLLVDTTYELPVAFEVTRASVTDVKQLQPLVAKTQQLHSELLQRSRCCTADKGYDSGPDIAKLYDQYGIAPVIDIRNCWQDGEATRPLYPDRADQIVYDHNGTVSCHCPQTGEVREMAFMGFEADRKTLKYRCPAAAYGLECLGRAQCGTCPSSDFGRIVRIPLASDRRIFTPVARSSYRWKQLYSARTAVERVNSRLDVSFGFELHTIRGLTKMKVRVGLALVVMLALAVGSIRAGQRGAMRSLVAPRARAA